MQDRTTISVKTSTGDVATIGEYCSWQLACLEDGSAVMITEIDGKSIDEELDEAIATGNPLALDTPIVRVDSDGKYHRVR